MARDYDRNRDEQNRRDRDASNRGRDIGGPPREVYDDERRAEADKSLQAFLESYFPEAFPLKWSADHLKVIEIMERVATTGELFALAMPRGSGKTTIATRAALWAILTNRRQYVEVIASTQQAAQKIIKTMRSELSFNDQLRFDYPNELHGIWQLNGDNRRAGGQLCHGEKTGVVLGVTEIVFPTHKYSPVSGCVIYGAGLTGQIRGPNHTKLDGSVIRPDFVILDDPQTRESAKSAAQTKSREETVNGDVLGLAGPGKTIAAVMPCTVIANKDLADRYLSNPKWHSLRAKMLYSMPDDLALWDEYFEERAEGRRVDGTFERGDRFYLEHRAPMDAGGAVGWEERKKPEEISALQSAMHLWYHDPYAFAAEYQNEPIEQKLDANRPTFKNLENKLTRLDRGVAPVWATKLTAAIDVGQNLLTYVVLASRDDFAASVIDYGACPEQGRHYYTMADASPSLKMASGESQLEPALWWGMDRLTTSLLGKSWQKEGGGEMRIDRCLIDSGWGDSANIVFEFCRRSPFAGVLMPSKGVGLKGSKASMNDWEHRQGDSPAPKDRDGWLSRQAQGRAIRHVLMDANHWKTFIAQRSQAVGGGKGSLSVFGARPEDHRMFADHLAAEDAKWVKNERGERWEWDLKPGHDNHLLDCLYMAAVAAAMVGARLDKVSLAVEPKKTVRMSDLQRAKRMNR